MRYSYLLRFVLLLASSEGWAQATYTPWQTIYEEGANETAFRVQVSFRLTKKDCKTSPVSYYRTSVSRSKPKAYLRFSFTYRGCDGALGTESPTVELEKAGVREGGGMLFPGIRLEGGVFAVKMTDYGSKTVAKSNAGSNEIVFSGSSADNTAKPQQEQTIRKRQEPQRQQADTRQNTQQRQAVSEYDQAVTQGKATQDAINTLGDAAQTYVQQRYEQKKKEQQEQDRKAEEREERRARKEEAQERVAEAKRVQQNQTMARAEAFVKPRQPPSSAWPATITAVYYFAYAVTSQAIVASAKPFAVHRHSDGGWPFLIDTERLFKEEASRHGYSISQVITSGYYNTYQEAQDSHEAFMQELGTGRDLVLVPIIVGQQGSAATKVNTTADFWDTGKAAPTEKAKPTPAPKNKPAPTTKSFWDN
ncbi:hypothetical protein [Fibrella arboris]|uniref:hypothetical protein n=1 Tax=Fibrella arboris TaxID=3242486 RepID=UPI00351FAED3